VVNFLKNKFKIISYLKGMRGAVALALALHMDVETPETKKVILTSTLFIMYNLRNFSQ